MDIAVPSRFACLKIEDEDFPSHAVRSKDARRKEDKKAVVKKTEKGTGPADKPAGVKKSSNSEKQMPVLTNNNNKGRKRQTARQWEEWKMKDDEIVNGNFEEDLQNAILLSTLDYEHNKDMYKRLQDADAKDKAQSKKKKSKAMSLDQFLNNDNGTDKQNANSFGLDVDSKLDKDDNFFDKVQSEAKVEYNKEQVKEKRKKRDANIDEIISLAQCQEKLEQEKAKVYVLEKQVQKLKLENVAVKERNKTLCGILGQGEMKDKADVLAELEKIYGEKNELSEEVSKLHVLLEQERSKVAALISESQTNKYKDKKRKQKGV